MSLVAATLILGRSRCGVHAGPGSRLLSAESSLGPARKEPVRGLARKRTHRGPPRLDTRLGMRGRHPFTTAGLLGRCRWRGLGAPRAAGRSGRHRFGALRRLEMRRGRWARTFQRNGAEGRPRWRRRRGNSPRRRDDPWRWNADRRGLALGRSARRDKSIGQRPRRDDRARHRGLGRAHCTPAGSHEAGGVGRHMQQSVHGLQRTSIWAILTA